MTSLTIAVAAEHQAPDPIVSGLSFRTRYQRIVRPADPAVRDGQPEVAPAEHQFLLSNTLGGAAEIADYADGTTVNVTILDRQGALLVDFGERKPQVRDGQSSVKIAISEAQVKQIVTVTTPKPPASLPTMSARAEFKTTDGSELAFSKFSLVVAPVQRAALPDDKLEAYFEDLSGSALSCALSVPPNKFLSDLRAASMQAIPVTIKGQFEFTIPAQDFDDAWLWTLSGPKNFAGLVDRSAEIERFRRVLWLPISADVPAEPAPGRPEGPNSPCECPPVGPLPVDPTEEELLGNPELFADDPGTRCKPFSSPNRIVGEKSFHTVLRVTQPEISADPAAPRPPRPRDLAGLFDLDASVFVMAAARPQTDSDAGRSVETRGRIPLSKSILRNLSNVRKAITSSLADSGTSVLTPEADVIAAERDEILKRPGGRSMLSVSHALDWEDTTPAQAVSLAFGHILDHRVRWRNNGYSLGDVLYSLALAPRQTKRILTVHSEIRDTAMRREVTSVSERLAQQTTRDYSYTDAVQAELSEWAKGHSSSSTTGAAGGFGLAIGPVVLGGGASHGRADSESWQEGGRKTAALEEQSLRDAIRQYGDSLRKLESVIIQEQTQEETTQAVSEIVRNPNYCHSLTIVYHQILRHLRVDTEIVGARECVFVPLAVSPFTWMKMIRWRDVLTAAMMNPEMRWVMPYLEDVQNDFLNSTIADGRRADQPIRYLSGSIYIQLAVERPADAADDAYEQAKWLILAPYAMRPVKEIHERLKQALAQRDQIFQSEYAPGIAAKWIDRLMLKVAGVALNGVDMTLATRYGFNSTIRVDFTCTPDKVISRKDLESFTIEAPADATLTPGSVANVKRVAIQYYTADFDRTKSSATLAHDLVNVSDGTAQAGANIFIPLDDWEKVDQRSFIRTSALKLKQHLNENLEHYLKHIWWGLDRDKLYMLLDTIYVLSVEDGRSVASVVERNPIAILGNSLVYRVAAGAHLGIDGHATSAELNAYYRNSVAPGEPIRVSLPTAGVYAQALLDDCEACEEHFGSTEWILSDKEPELAALDPGLLASRRAATPELTPTPLPTSIINLQNAPNVPAPSGFAGAFDAITNANAFRDMAGLAGTQANAKAAMESAASLAQQFGTQAAEIRKAEIAAKIAKEKLGVIDKAEKAGAVSPEVAQKNREKVLDQMNADTGARRDSAGESDLIDKVQESGVSYKRVSPDGDQVEIQPKDLSTMLGDMLGDPNAVILAKSATPPSGWGQFGKEWALFDSEAKFTTASKLLLRSSTFNTRAAALGKRYRSVQDWRERRFKARGAANEAFEKEQEAIDAGTYKGQPFLEVVYDEGGAFLPGATMNGFGDVLQFGVYSLPDVPLMLVPEIAHEVSHAYRALAGRPPPADMAAAIIDGVAEEIQVRKDEVKILAEIERGGDIQFNANPELRPGNVEREVAPGIGLSYLELFAVGFLLEEARKAGGLSVKQAQDLRKAADGTFPAPPADQSSYSKMYFKRLRLKKSWKDFHAATPRTAADYVAKRNAKCDDNMHGILDSVAMYRAFLP